MRGLYQEQERCFIHRKHEYMIKASNTRITTPQWASWHALRATQLGCLTRCCLVVHWKGLLKVIICIFTRFNNPNYTNKKLQKKTKSNWAHLRNKSLIFLKHSGQQKKTNEKMHDLNKTYFDHVRRFIGHLLRQLEHFMTGAVEHDRVGKHEWQRPFELDRARHLAVFHQSLQRG